MRDKLIKSSKKIYLVLIINLIFILSLVAIGGCSSDLAKQEEGLDQHIINEAPENLLEEPIELNEIDLDSDNDHPNIPEQSKDDSMTKEEMAQLKVNELGQVMVLMYHVIGEQEGEWARTRENFRHDLHRLYQLGYRTVTMTDFLTGNINIPAGTSPIILTFDDGTIGQFRFLEENSELVVDPDSAVGIMLDFAKEYPDFGNGATFFINFPNPFGQPQYWQEKLNFLVENGMEVGNHSYNHPNLSRLSDEEVQRELATHVDLVRQAVPGYQVNSLALPFGISAQNTALEMSGKYQNMEYNHLAVLRVGANPSYPPEHTKFNPARVPRVRADQNELDKWLDYFDKNPHLRYISDGNQSTLAIPAAEKDNVDLEKLGSKELVIYDR